MDEGPQFISAHILKVRKLAWLANFLAINKHPKLFAD